MTIKEFCDAYKEKNFISTKEITEWIVQTLGIKGYISFDEKINISKKIMDFIVDYDRGLIKFDSVKKYLNFTFVVIEAHTDLCFSDDWKDKVQEYDLLCENDLLDAIICTFEKDYKASREILDMMCADILAENSLEASIAKLAQSVSENLDVFIGTLTDKLEDLDIEKIIPKDLDLNKLQRFLGKFK